MVKPKDRVEMLMREKGEIPPEQEILRELLEEEYQKFLRLGESEQNQLLRHQHLARKPPAPSKEPLPLERRLEYFRLFGDSEDLLPRELPFFRILKGCLAKCPSCGHKTHITNFEFDFANAADLIGCPACGIWGYYLLENPGPKQPGRRPAWTRRFRKLHRCREIKRGSSSPGFGYGSFD